MIGVKVLFLFLGTLFHINAETNFLTSLQMVYSVMQNTDFTNAFFTFKITYVFTVQV
jgi:hypothetical protein